ncbi:MAG: hypothetical protein A2Y25_02505 [Candidatus Melainabacteria bacterium GWF2_37_15]|nr:MAG: hypothetical protein A2Y25_02505 [Candidatus Melainabacteria bacterium GWF2_37_15]
MFKRFTKKIIRNGIKNILTGDDSLSIDGEQRVIKEEINKQAREVLKNAIDKPEILLDFIKSKGTQIVKSKHIHKILLLFGETEGFITPMKGIKALLFTTVINMFSPVKLKAGFSTPAIFALNDEPVNIYILAHQFHLWLSYINNLPGFEERTLYNFKNFWKQGHQSQDVSYLSVDEIFSLKDIIARELEALSFVKELGREFEGQKKSIKKLREGGSVNL